MNWLIRGGFFVAVGALAGTSTVSLRRSFQAGLTEQPRAELDLAAATNDLPGDPGWETRIRQMLDRRDFHPVFQPIYALDDGRLLAVEALTRFDTDPASPPHMWFDHAARVGLGIEPELTQRRADSLAWESGGHVTDLDTPADDQAMAQARTHQRLPLRSLRAVRVTFCDRPTRGSLLLCVFI